MNMVVRSALDLRFNSLPFDRAVNLGKKCYFINCIRNDHKTLKIGELISSNIQRITKCTYWNFYQNKNKN